MCIVAQLLLCASQAVRPHSLCGDTTLDKKQAPAPHLTASQESATDKTRQLRSVVGIDPIEQTYPGSYMRLKPQGGRRQDSRGRRVVLAVCKSVKKRTNELAPRKGLPVPAREVVRLQFLAYVLPSASWQLSRCMDGGQSGQRKYLRCSMGSCACWMRAEIYTISSHCWIYRI